MVASNVNKLVCGFSQRMVTFIAPTMLKALLVWSEIQQMPSPCPFKAKRRVFAKWPPVTDANLASICRLVLSCTREHVTSSSSPTPNCQVPSTVTWPKSNQWGFLVLGGAGGKALPRPVPVCWGPLPRDGPLALNG